MSVIMTDVPEDIRLAANNVADQSACASWEEVADMIAAVLVAERRRCAALARTMSTVIDDVGVARMEIADAIERGDQP